MWRNSFDRRDETIAAPSDGLDIRRLCGIVAERLAQLRDRLRQRVVGDGDVRPERAEELVLRDERRLPGDEVKKEIDDLRREGDDLVPSQQPVRRRVDSEGAESIRSRHRSASA
jgi:hypothetical protein